MRLRAALTHATSSVLGLAAGVLGVLWVGAAGEVVAAPAAIVVLSLMVLGPIAVRRHWNRRGQFVDDHVRAACRFLTSVGFAALLTVGLPVLISWPLESGSVVWAGLLVLPAVMMLALPVTWAFFAGRAAVRAWRGLTDPYPPWAILVGRNTVVTG